MLFRLHNRVGLCRGLFHPFLHMLEVLTLACLTCMRQPRPLSKSVSRHGHSVCTGHVVCPVVFPQVSIPLTHDPVPLLDVRQSGRGCECGRSLLVATTSRELHRRERLISQYAPCIGSLVVIPEDNTSISHEPVPRTRQSGRGCECGRSLLVATSSRELYRYFVCVTRLC